MEQPNWMTKWFLIALCTTMLSISDTIAEQQSLPKTAAEIVQIQKSQTRPYTVHMVLTVDSKDNRVPYIDARSAMPYKKEVGMILANTSVKKELWIDSKNMISKGIETTIRDVEALKKKHNLPGNLPDDVRLNIVNREVHFVHQPPYSMDITFKSGCSPFLSIDKRDNMGFGGYMRLLGSLDYVYMAEDMGLKPSLINNIKENGKDLLRITYKSDRGTTIIDSIPSLGYVLYHKKSFDAKNRLMREEVADDYRNADGVQYPFLHIEREFDPNSGELKYEQKYTFEKVEFGVPLSADDFKIYVPIGTEVEDFVTDKKTNPNGTETIIENYKTTTAAYMSIQDVLEMSSSRLSNSKPSENKK